MPSYKNRAVPMPMKPERWFGIFNYGRLVGMRYRRRDAWRYVDALNPNRRCYTVEPLMVTKAKRKAAK